MSSRELIFDFVSRNEPTTRAALYAEFGACRKPLFRMVGMGELIREGDTYRIGARSLPAHRPWGRDEDAVIVRMLGSSYSEIASTLCGRTHSAVKRRARDLGLVEAKVRRVELAPVWPAYTRGNLSPLVRCEVAA